MVQTVKNGMKLWKSQWGNFSGYLDKLLLNYRTIPHAQRQKSASEMMGRQIRAPILCSTKFTPGRKVIYNDKEATVVVQKGSNTYLLNRQNEVTLVHEDQIRLSYSSDEEDESTETNEQDQRDTICREVEEQEKDPIRRSQRLAVKSPIDYRSLSEKGK